MTDGHTNRRKDICFYRVALLLKTIVENKIYSCACPRSPEYNPRLFKIPHNYVGAVNFKVICIAATLNVWESKYPVMPISSLQKASNTLQEKWKEKTNEELSVWIITGAEFLNQWMLTLTQPLPLPTM